MLFAIYTLGVFGYVCQELFNKVLYLDLKYSYTAIGTVAVILSKIGINAVIGDKSVFLTALTTTFLFTLYALNIALAMRKVIGKYIDKELIVNIVKILLSGACAFLVFVLCKYTMPLCFEMKLAFILPLIICGGVYLTLLFASGIVRTVIEGKKGE